MWKNRFATLAWIALAPFLTSCIGIVSGPPAPSVPDHTNAWLSYKYSRNCGSYANCAAIIDDTAEAGNYYQAIGATAFPTLAAWKTFYGFPAGSNPPAHAIYANQGDLQLGRDMNCVQNAANIACYVSNYGPPPADCSPDNSNAANCPWPNLDVAISQAISGNNNGNPSGNPVPFATVAMVFTRNSGQPNNQNNVTFYVFAGANQTLAPDAKLDGEGAKSVPRMCMACHGGRYDTNSHAALGASFLPFDAFYFKFSKQTGFGLDDQQEGFRNLNMLVEAVSGTYPIAASGAARSTNVVTITTAVGHSLVVGDSVNISGITDTTFNGNNVAVASVPSSTSFTYSQTGPDSNSGGGSVSLASQTASQAAIVDFINGLYCPNLSSGGLLGVCSNPIGTSGSKAVDGYVPSGWSPATSGYADSAKLYTHVERQYCRMCHLAQAPQAPTFLTFPDFNASLVNTFACSLRDMPHAEVPLGGPPTSANPNVNPFTDPHHFWLDSVALSDLKNFMNSQNPPIASCPN